MMEMVTRQGYDSFKFYVRRMINDIASAQTGPYHNNPQIQEIALVWNECEAPALEGYPCPENLTHINSRPYDNRLELGEYVFKSVIKNLMKRAGFREHNRVLISQMEKNEFECTMHSGHGPAPVRPSQIYCFFIRANGDLGKAQELLSELDDKTLDVVCRESLADCKIKIDENAAPSSQHPLQQGPF
jgi:hypothetical protein